MGCIPRHRSRDRAERRGERYRRQRGCATTERLVVRRLDGLFGGRTRRRRVDPNQRRGIDFGATRARHQRRRSHAAHLCIVIFRIQDQHGSVSLRRSQNTGHGVAASLRSLVVDLHRSRSRFLQPRASLTRRRRSPPTLLGRNHRIVRRRRQRRFKFNFPIAFFFLIQ